jgi:hypothetical protein
MFKYSGIQRGCKGWYTLTGSPCFLIFDGELGSRTTCGSSSTDPANSSDITGSAELILVRSILYASTGRKGGRSTPRRTCSCARCIVASAMKLVPISSSSWPAGNQLLVGSWIRLIARSVFGRRDVIGGRGVSVSLSFSEDASLGSMFLYK